MRKSMLELTKKECAVLQSLAQDYMELALLPVQKEKRELWLALNRLEMQRPMFAIDQLPWHEMDVDGELVCQVTHPYWKGVEEELRRKIYLFRHMPADMVLNPYLTLPRPIEYTGYGIEIEEKTLASDTDNDVVAHSFTNLIEEPEDIEKIKTPKAILDEAQEREIIQQAEALFAGIAPFRMAGLTLHLGVWDFITQWMGVENVYIELMDRPEMMHALMERVTNCTIELIEQMNRDRLFDVYTNICHCSYTFTDDLPLPNCDPDHPTSENVWAFGLAQLFTSVSPQITKEFEVPYMKRIFPYFGAIYYGCCDRLDDRLEIIAEMPKIRKISCSPWSDRENFAAKLPKHYIMSNKPSPVFLGGDSVDYDAIRADIRRTLKAARDNQVNLELILKDISTVHYEPQRLWNWSRIVQEEVERC